MVNQYRRILFPSDEIEEILAVLRCSPSAMVLMMSISKKENIVIGALITNLFILIQDIFKDQTDLENLDVQEYSQRLEPFSEDSRFKELRPTPILQLVRAMAIADIFADNTLIRDGLTIPQEIPRNWSALSCTRDDLSHNVRSSPG